MKKTFTAEEVEEIKNEALKTGFYQSYEMFDRVVKRLRNSLEDVWSIEQGEVFPVNNTPLVEKMEFAVKTLEYLEDMIEAETYERPDLR